MTDVASPREHLRRRRVADAARNLAMRTREEFWFAILGITFFSGGLDRLLVGFRGGYSIAAAEAGRPLVQAIGLLLYAGSVFLMLRNRRNPLTELLRSPLLLVMMAYITVSISWSANTGISIRHVIGLWGTLLFGLYLVGTFSAAQIVRMCALCLGGLAVASLLLAVGVPRLGMGHNAGGMVGLWDQKNDFGKAMIVGVLFLSAHVWRKPPSRERSICYVMLGAAVIGAVLSRSGTAALCLALLPAVIAPTIVLLSRLMRRASLGFFVMLGLICVSGFYIGQLAFGAILAALGKNPTLTDRTVIWSLLQAYVDARPWLGYGYGGFWQSAEVVRFTMRWNAISHAHNGYMDILLEMGRVGLGLVALVLLSALRRAADAYFVGRRTEDLALAAFMVVTMIANYVGRLYPEHNSLYWVLLVVIASRTLKVARPVFAPRAQGLAVAAAAQRSA